MSNTVVVVTGEDRLIASMYGIEVPVGGVDVGGWNMLLDSLFPVLEESPLLVKFLLDIAPVGADEGLLELLRGLVTPWAAEPEVVTFA